MYFFTNHIICTLWLMSMFLLQNLTEFVWLFFFSKHLPCQVLTKSTHTNNLRKLLFMPQCVPRIFTGYLVVIVYARSAKLSRE